MTQMPIPGYALGAPQIPRAPITLQEMALLQQTLLITDDDLAALRLAREVLADQTEAILDVWYGFVGSHPHLLDAFVRPADGTPDEAYLAAVRRRFGQWILDTTLANYDQAWLDYAFEIGRRHHRIGKNKTDGVAASPHVPFRYLLALVVPIVATVRPFLERKGHRPDEVERMSQAWLKAVLLQVILWSYPYVRDGDF